MIEKGHEYLVNDPAFSEYVFHVMSNTTRQQIMKLGMAERRHFKTPLVTRNFADKASIEQRLYMLCRLNKSFTIVVCPDEIELESILEVLEHPEHPSKRLTTIEKMAGENTFMMGSRNLLPPLQLGAMNSHSGVYVLNYDYTRTYREIKKSEAETLNAGVRSALKGFDFIANMAANSLAGNSIIQSVTGVDKHALRILVMLYLNRNNFISTSTMAETLEQDDNYGRKVIRKLCARMGELEYILLAKDGVELTYCIMEKGIEAVAAFIKYVIQESVQLKPLAL